MEPALTKNSCATTILTVVKGRTKKVARCVRLITPTATLPPVYRRTSCVMGWMTAAMDQTKLAVVS